MLPQNAILMPTEKGSVPGQFVNTNGMLNWKGIVSTPTTSATPPIIIQPSRARTEVDLSS